MNDPLEQHHQNEWDPRLPLYMKNREPTMIKLVRH
jgi:hypothetical protein